MAYSKRRLSHKKELYYILCIVAVLAILLVSLFGPGGYQDLRRARLQLQEQHIRVDRLDRENSKRRKSIEKMRSDKYEIEKHAREKGYGREGEIIQQLPTEPEQPRSARPSKP